MGQRRYKPVQVAQQSKTNFEIEDASLQVLFVARCFYDVRKNLKKSPRAMS